MAFVDVEQRLQDFESPSNAFKCTTRIKNLDNANGSLAEFAYALCCQERKLPCAYPPRECLSDHLVVALYIQTNQLENAAIKLYGLKSLPVLQIGNEVLQLFEDRFEDHAEYFKRCNDIMIRRSRAGDFEQMAEAYGYETGDFIFGVVRMDEDCPNSVAVSRQPSFTSDDVYRRVPQQQPVDTSLQMAVTAKHINMASVEFANSNSQEALETCIIQQNRNPEASAKDPVVHNTTVLHMANESLVPGKFAFCVSFNDKTGRNYAKEEVVPVLTEQVLPNHCEEKGVQFKGPLMMINDNAVCEEHNVCPFQAGRTEEIDCYVHALEIVCAGIPVVPCSPECKDRIEHCMVHVKQELDDLKSGVASDNLKHYIRMHCQKCRLQSCKVPHMAAGCPLYPLSATTYKSSTTTTTHSPISPMDIQNRPTQITLAGVRDVSVDMEPFQNSSQTAGFVRNPIPEHNPDGDCRVHVHAHPLDATVHLDVPTVYLPAPGGKSTHINHLIVQSKDDLPHDLSTYLHGTVIYSAKKTDNMQDMQHIFSPGSCNSWIPDFLKTPTSTTLGRGGNGITFAYTVSNTDFAVKETKYRRSEIRMWRQFDHPNVIPLLAVVSLQSSRCLQFMPRMTCNLRNEVEKIVSLQALFKLQNGEDQWKSAVYPNLKHILISTLNGLVHLHDVHHVQHCDMKPHNILIHYECNHDHSKSSVFSCTDQNRCSVKICDFDSIKEFGSTYYNTDNTIAKTKVECGKVLGTKGYRAPEKFLKPDLSMNPAALGADVEGPWCDIWSFGSCILFISLGPGDKRDADMFKKEKGSESDDDRDERVEPLMKLTVLYGDQHKPLNEVGHFAAKCVQPQPKQRPTARDLLQDPFLC